jgi:hypothetical protein
MSDGETLIAARSALADDSGESLMRVSDSVRHRFQTPPQSYTEAELWLYRDRTTGLLRRYIRMSVEVGRLPSLLGRANCFVQG